MPAAPATDRTAPEYMMVCRTAGSAERDTWRERGEHQNISQYPGKQQELPHQESNARFQHVRYFEMICEDGSSCAYATRLFDCAAREMRYRTLGQGLVDIPCTRHLFSDGSCWRCAYI